MFPTDHGASHLPGNSRAIQTFSTSSSLATSPPSPLLSKCSSVQLPLIIQPDRWQNERWQIIKTFTKEGRFPPLILWHCHVFHELMLQDLLSAWDSSVSRWHFWQDSPTWCELFVVDKMWPYEACKFEGGTFSAATGPDLQHVLCSSYWSHHDYRWFITELNGDELNICPVFFFLTWDEFNDKKYLYNTISVILTNKKHTALNKIDYGGVFMFRFNLRIKYICFFVLLLTGTQT